jgi:hypothetical protein
MGSLFLKPSGLHSGQWPDFSSSFNDPLKSSGVKAVHIVKESPKMNAYCERVVRTIREEAGLSKKALGVQTLLQHGKAPSRA